MKRDYVRRLAAAPIAAFLVLALATGCEDRTDVDTNIDPVSADGATAPPKMVSAKEGDAMRYSLAFPTGDRATSALLVEKVAPAQVRVGQPYQYEIRVTNLTDAPLAGVTIVESLGQGFEFDQSQPTTRPSYSAAPTTRPSSVAPTWVLGELPAKATETIRVTAVPTEVGKIGTCLSATYTPALCAVVEVVNPQLKLVKQGPTRAHLCDEIKYTYTVSNLGTGAAKDVVVRDPLPEGLTTADGKNEVVVQVGELPAGASKEVSATLKPSRTGTFASRAIAKSATDEVRTGRLETVIQEPVLAVDVVGPEWKYVGQPVTYTVRVTNTGDAVARDAKINLEAAGLAEADRVRELGNIEPGQTRATSVTLAGDGIQEVKLTASAASACAKAQPDAVVTRVRALPALLLETVDNQDPVRIGSNTTYTIAVKNQGHAPATNVTLTANLPPELQFVEADGATKVNADGQKLTFDPIAELPPGEVATWIVEAKASKAGDVRFHLEMNSDYLSQPVPEVEPTRLH